MNLIIRISVLLVLIICYKYIPVFEPRGINYLLSIINLALIANECKKTWDSINFSETLKLDIKNIFYYSLISTVLISIIIIIHKTDPAGNIRFVRVVLIVALLFVGGKIINSISKSSVSNLLKNISLISFSTISFVALIEIIFMFISLSHGSGEAYSGKIWGNKYWNPINQLGFRDEEPKKGKNTVFFVGDSFTAGWGVKNIEDRFGETMSRELKKKDIIIMKRLILLLL